MPPETRFISVCAVPPALELDALAPGLRADPSFDLRDFGGRKLPALSYRNVFLGAWDDADAGRVDAALAAAMTDEGLNGVLAQYFPGEAVATTPLPAVHEGLALEEAGKGVVEGLAAKHAEGGDTVLNFLLPRGVVLSDDGVDSHHGLGGYHGSVHTGGATQLYAVGVYSEGGNGIDAFGEAWRNVVATSYHELQEARTDPDVEEANRTGDTSLLGWYSSRGGEIGDGPILEARGDLGLVFREVPLRSGGSAPIQLLWSNAVHGPELP